MGKAVKTVLKIAAVAAISYFAPPLAGAALNSLGVSSALGATGTALAKTALSSVIGAGMGELTGVGWRAGLMAGGLGGAGSSNLFGGGVPAGATNAPAPGLGGPLPGAVGSLPTATNPALSIAPATGASATPVAGIAGAAPTAGVAGAAPQTLGQMLSGAVARPSSIVTGGLSNLSQGLTGLSQGITGGLNTVGRAVGLGTPAAAGAAPAAGAAAGPLHTYGAATAAPAAAATAAPSLGQTLMSNVLPSMFAASLTATPGADLVAAQQAELQRAQDMNAALAEQRLAQAKQLFNEAAYYDPEYMARQAAEAAQIRGGLREVEGTRGLTGERRDAERRRFRLGTARAAGSAYQQGYGTGVGARMEARRAGIQAMPTGYPTTAGESSMALQNLFAADEQRRKEEEGMAKLFGQVLHRPYSTPRKV